LKKKFAVLYLLITSLCFAALPFVLFYGFGYRVNLSESLPGYIYRAIPLKEGEVLERGGGALIDLPLLHTRRTESFEPVIHECGIMTPLGDEDL
jgi:hypothetical protein